MLGVRNLGGGFALRAKVFPIPVFERTPTEF